MHAHRITKEEEIIALKQVFLTFPLSPPLLQYPPKQFFHSELQPMRLPQHLLSQPEKIVSFKAGHLAETEVAKWFLPYKNLPVSPCVFCM